MTGRGRAAFVMAHNRQEMLDQAVAAIQPQVDMVLVLDNASSPKLTVAEGVSSMYLPHQPPNLARWWNVGMNFFGCWYGEQPYDLAILCDDAIVPEGWFDAVTQAMRSSGCVAGSANPFGHQHGPMVKRCMDSDIMHRMCSWAFIVDGATNVRADESMHWWWFDSSLDIDLRRSGGTVLIGSHATPNSQPNYYTNLKPELGEQAGRDREAFVARYGQTPW